MEILLIILIIVVILGFGLVVYELSSINQNQHVIISNQRITHNNHEETINWIRNLEINTR